MNDEIILEKEGSPGRNKTVSVLYMALRVLIVFALVAMFIPAFNPGRIATGINRYTSLVSKAF